MEEKNIILKVDGLSKEFGKNRVLNRISFELKEGTVLGLMGENGAGKSTLMKCIFGIYAKDEGEIIFKDKPVSFTNPKDALENGIAMVHQELNQCLDRNVLDNLYLGRYPKAGPFIDTNRMKKEATELFRRLNILVDLKTPMRKMSVSTRQMIEIAKAISYDAKVIVLDEPTSSLTEPEVKKLFGIIRDLKKQGVSFIYISHKMDEIFKICDEISVMRDGIMVFTKPIANTNMGEIIKAMVGRSLEKRFPVIDNEPKDIILDIDNLCTKYEPKLQNITFSVREGEIFGLYGLVGAGRSELLETIFGLRTRSSGEIRYKGRLKNFLSSREAISNGFALVTEERKFNGLFLKSNIAFNTCIADVDKYSVSKNVTLGEKMKKYFHVRGFEIGKGVISKKKIKQASDEEIKVMHTKCMSSDDPITALSGGNQQKVIIGRWLETKPKVFLMDEPTRGIDVGAKYEIYELILKMAKNGTTVIVVSSEMPEILGITNRIGVMSNGRLAGIVDTKKTNQEELLKLSARFL